MVELLNKVWQSKTGKAAILGGGGLVCGGAVYFGHVSETAREVDVAGAGIIGLLVLVAAAAGPKAVKFVAGLVAPKDAPKP